MSDVSKLTPLATLISKSSNRIRDYSLEQARVSAAQQAELDALTARVGKLEAVPAPVPQPPAGVVWHDDGFDSGTWENWDYAQPTMTQAASFVPGLRPGSKALRVTLKAGDANQLGLEAAQLSKINPGGYRLAVAGYPVDVYAVRYRLLSVTDCFDFLTFAYPTIRYGAISLNVTNGQVCLHMNTGRTLNDIAPSHDFQVWADPLSNAALGQWQEKLVTVKRATDRTGALTIEQRYDGAGSWRTVWAKTDIPTAQYGTAFVGYGQVDAAGINLVDVANDPVNRVGAPRPVIDKLGPYRAKQPAGAPDFTVEYDVYRACTSRELALAALA